MTRTALNKKYNFENPFKPDPLSRKGLHYLDGGKRLLDVGCGEGADSVFFARKGFSVTSIDKNGEHLKHFRAYCADRNPGEISIRRRSAVTYRYPPNRYDAAICLLVICCMRRREVEEMLPRLKRSVRKGGVIVMSARNERDPEFGEYRSTEKMIEPNTFRTKEDCCKYLYFIEKNRLRTLFDGFEILYYYEGRVACKYGEHPHHSDSHIICRKR